MPRPCSSLLLPLLIASSASAVTMAWTPIGNPGNACDPQTQGCFGAVGYAYNIGTYEVTNSQYAEFLNAKAVSDPLALYNESMASLGYPGYGSGITRSGSPGSYTYSAVAGRENSPVSHASFYDAVRFANWMNNGQGSGDTETGAYTLLGGTPTPSNPGLTRDAGATILLSSENEWYKAAYYDAGSMSYFDFPTGSNTLPLCTWPGSTSPNAANCNFGLRTSVTPVGSYTASPSPYGTFDQGGNLFEWNETSMFLNPSRRSIRGGWYESDKSELAAPFRFFNDASIDYAGVGFRLVMIPEPGTGLLVIAGLLGLAGWRRGRA